MNVRHSIAYEKLAVEAGRQSGMKKPTAESVADDATARQLRDVLWGDYERQLRDTNTYKLSVIGQWLGERNSSVAISSVHRDRTALICRERALAMAAGKARAVIEAASESGEHDLLRGGRLLAGQLLFNSLSELSGESLEGLTAQQILSLINTLGSLSKAHAETDMIRAKLDEMSRKFDESIAAAKRRAAGGDGKITDDMLKQVREAVFGRQVA